MSSSYSRHYEYSPHMYMYALTVNVKICVNKPNVQDTSTSVSYQHLILPNCCSEQSTSVEQLGQVHVRW